MFRKISYCSCIEVNEYTCDRDISSINESEAYPKHCFRQLLPYRNKGSIVLLCKYNSNAFSLFSSTDPRARDFLNVSRPGKKKQRNRLSTPIRQYVNL
jgi:hypothetical protein